MKTFKIAMAAVALMILVMAGSAMAFPSADVIFTGFPTGPYAQQDKIYNNFTDVNGNFEGRTGIKFNTLPGYVDVHTVSFTGLAVREQIYDITYTIEVDAAISDLWLNAVGIGIDQSFGSGTPASLQKKVWGWIADGDGGAWTATTLMNVTTSGNVGDTDIGLWKKLLVEDILTVNGAIVNSVSNSFTQTARAVPEPGTLGLLGIGLAGLVTVARRRKWRA